MKREEAWKEKCKIMVNQENKQINKKDAPDRIKPVLNGAAETMLQSF